MLTDGVGNIGGFVYLECVLNPATYFAYKVFCVHVDLSKIILESISPKIIF